jgi:2-polyprenyl-3-methyl-5-hydroxy-6-metoxy-1,4-benzoquinol methylase
MMTCNCCDSVNARVIYNLKSRLCTSGLGSVYNISKDSFEAGDVKIVRCLNCGLIYLEPKPDTAQLLQVYANMQDDLYLTQEKSRSRSAKLLLGKLSRYKGKGRLLDVGCATGILLNEAKKLGWEVYGVELSSWAISLAREKFGIDICRGTLKDAKFPGNYFDAVVMADSIEHFYNPKDSLKEAARILKTDGIICLSTPDAGSILSKIMGKNWHGIKKSHLFYFNKTTISKMLNDSGFKILGFSSHTRFFSLDYLFLRFVNLFGLRSKKLSFIRLPFFSSIVLKINLGDQLEVYARKKLD